MPSFPPRLHCILAREARVGIVIRRGPTKSVCTLRWDLDKDSFKLGQWMRGRIYERRCDLSPDGKHFLYFAMNGRWQSESTGAWTAVSKTPYLKATTMLTKGDCWHGGGLFTSNHHYWLNDGHGHQVLRDDRQLVRDPTFQPKEYFGGECPHVYYNRLMRYGWNLLTEVPGGAAHVVFEKALGSNLVLRKYCFAEIDQPPGNGCYYDRHAMLTKEGELVQDLPQWQWAEVDKRRLVWAEDGRLYSSYVHKSGIRDPKLLHDFSAMKFEARPAPY